MQRLLLLLFLVSSASILSARTWYINKNQNGQVLQNLINQASGGDMIYFIDAGDYNMGGAIITVNKGITFQGVTPQGFDNTVRGYSGARTRLMNVGSFQIRSNNVKFNNIRLRAVDNDGLLIDGRSQLYASNFTNPGYPVDDQYTGIEFNNVELYGGFYSCFAGNGMQADFSNVSFTNFQRIGYINDRRTRVNDMKQVTFFRCKFTPVPPAGMFGFDSRGISLDAGNTEYPVVWNANGSYVIECRFENTGVALSRIQNINISANVFQDNNALVDMIHAEEFSNNILISWNTFNGNAGSTRTDFERSRIITLDSELQRVADITIDNNFVNGEYNFFVFGYAPTNLRIRNNNLTQGFPFNPRVINLDYYENAQKTGEEIAANQQFASTNVTITGNTGLANGNRECRINVPPGGGNNVINNSQFGAGKVVRRNLGNPVALVGNGVYRLVNAGNNNRKLASNGNNFTLTTKNSNNNSTLWRFTWVPPYYYEIENVANGRHLETHKGYTEKEILDQVPQTVTPFLAFPPATKPRWILRKGGMTGLFKILPAGNEKQSVLYMNGTAPRLFFHKQFNPDGSRSILEPDNFGRWWVVPQGSSRAATPSHDELTTNANTSSSPDLLLYPTIPTEGLVNLYYESVETPQLKVAFYGANGQLVKHTVLNAFVTTAVDVSQFSAGTYVVRAGDLPVRKMIIR